MVRRMTEKQPEETKLYIPCNHWCGDDFRLRHADPKRPPYRRMDFHDSDGVRWIIIPRSRLLESGRGITLAGYEACGHVTLNQMEYAILESAVRP